MYDWRQRWPLPKPLYSQHCCMDARRGLRTDATSRSSLIIRAQLDWSGHVVRISDDRLPKIALYGELQSGTRAQGGQYKRYKDVLKACKIDTSSWESSARDRCTWRQVCVSGVNQFEEFRISSLQRNDKREKTEQQPLTVSPHRPTAVLHADATVPQGSVCILTTTPTSDPGDPVDRRHSSETTRPPLITVATLYIYKYIGLETFKWK
jgi:hypothetical protein